MGYQHVENLLIPNSVDDAMASRQFPAQCTRIIADITNDYVALKVRGRMAKPIMSCFLRVRIHFAARYR